MIHYTPRTTTVSVNQVTSSGDESFCEAGVLEYFCWPPPPTSIEIRDVWEATNPGLLPLAKNPYQGMVQPCRSARLMALGFSPCRRLKPTREIKIKSLRREPEGSLYPNQPLRRGNLLKLIANC
jgi:hypothetical protein